MKYTLHYRRDRDKVDKTAEFASLAGMGEFIVYAAPIHILSVTPIPKDASK